MSVSSTGRWVIAIGFLMSTGARAGDPDYVNAPQKERCAPGYQHRGGSICVPLVVPLHAHATVSGHDWQCDTGYRKEAKGCVRLRQRMVLPPPTCTDHERGSGAQHSSNLIRRCD